VEIFLAEENKRLAEVKKKPQREEKKRAVGVKTYLPPTFPKTEKMSPLLSF